MPTILCIDDDPRVLQTESALLEAKGYRVLSAPNGTTAIEITRKHSVDAIVLDLIMGGMDGNGVAQVLMKEQRSVPVAIFSGSVDDVPEDLKWYADALVNKGDGPEAFLSAVTRLVEIAKAKKYLLQGAVKRRLHDDAA
jgi:CheY-like chemotaxis protein